MLPFSACPCNFCSVGCVPKTSVYINIVRMLHSTLNDTSLRILCCRGTLGIHIVLINYLGFIFPTNFIILMTFMLCKPKDNSISHVISDSSSDSEEEMSSQFYSIHEAKQRERRKQRQEQLNRQSTMCFSLNIGQGQLAIGAPLRVSSIFVTCKFQTTNIKYFFDK